MEKLGEGDRIPNSSEFNYGFEEIPRHPVGLAVGKGSTITEKVLRTKKTMRGVPRVIKEWYLATHFTAELRFACTLIGNLVLGCSCNKIIFTLLQTFNSISLKNLAQGKSGMEDSHRLRIL